ncbi:hypothetical protein FACHB389_21480 [Nostoc calcicola FACHB-389]|nr:hypothetical protein FACHB389_21480 [Nostoc calcicola FACHB-389]
MGHGALGRSRGAGGPHRCRYLKNVAEIGFLRWLRTQILISDFPPKNEISLFEPRLELCLRVSTHAQIKNLHLSAMDWGETGKSSSLPLTRGGLGWGKQIFDTLVRMFSEFRILNRYPKSKIV